MVIKKLFLTTVLLFASLFMLVSQEADPLDLELDPLEEEQIDSALELRMRMEKEIAENNVLVQPISWEDAGEVLKYNVVIQRRSERPEANGRYSYTEVYRHETNEEETEECTVFLDPILPAGNYRLTIQVYNVLGMLEEDYTSTEDFIILEAHLPEVKRVSYPLNSGDTIYLDDGDNNGIIRATGKNFLSIQEGEEDLSYMDYTLSNDKRTLKAKEIVSLKQDGSEIEVHFDERSMDVGVYNFTATDASGLHSIPDKNSVITVKFKKLIDLDVSGGYMCPVIIFDDTVKTYMDTRLWPVSLVGKLTFIPYKQLWGYLGIGLSVFGTRYFGSGTTATYTLDGNFFNAQLNLVYQKPIYFKNKKTGKSSHRLTLEGHAGAGAMIFNGMTLHFEHDIKSEPLNSMNWSFNAGGALQVYITKRLYLETGADFIMGYVPFMDPAKGTMDMLLGAVIPSVSIGWQF